MNETATSAGETRDELPVLTRTELAHFSLGFHGSF